MRRRILLLGLSILVSASQQAEAQIETTVRSGDAEMVLTVWGGQESPTATVLLVPGWGGGPTDALGVAKALSASGTPVVVLTPRGWHHSGGTASFAKALEDIEAAVRWIKTSGEAGLHPTSVVLGGYSWGGGMSLAYAARDTSISRVFSIAGTDHGTFIRQYQSDPEFAAMVDPMLESTASPQGPIKFGVEATMKELMDGQAVYGLIENAGVLADRSILLIGGWEDANVTIDEYLLPLYRALRGEGADDVTFLTYHANHGFGVVRSELHKDLERWINR